jgi:hypothetical protein
LITLIIHNPLILEQEENIEVIYNINFSRESLNDLKDFIVEYVQDKLSKHNQTELKESGEYSNSSTETAKLEEELKNTRFYNEYSLLLASGQKYLGQQSIYNDQKNINNFFLWLYKQYYILQLKQEYSTVSYNNENNNKQNIERSAFYLKEIQKNSLELLKLGQQIIHSSN